MKSKLANHLMRTQIIINLSINHLKFKLSKPINKFYNCINNGLSYSSDLKIKFCLSNDNLKDFYNCEYVSIHNFPLLTVNGTFVIGGVEKTIVSHKVNLIY